MTRAANLAKLITDANLEGTLDVTGIGTFTDDIIIGDGKTIGSTSDVDAITIASNGQLTLTQTLIGTSLDISGDIDVDGITNLDVVDIDGAVDMASTLTVGGVTTLNGKFLIDGSNNDLMTFRTTGDTASQVLGLQFQNNSEAVTAQIFGTGDNSSSGVFRIKGIGDVAIVGGDIGVTGAAGDLVVKSGGDVHVGTGDLVFATSGKGIVLGATSNTAANTLDDYEEGTFTPAPSVGTVSSASGEYTKIGRLVSVRIKLATGFNTTNDEPQLIQGLPFTTSRDDRAIGSAMMNQTDNANRFGTAYIDSNSKIGLYSASETGSFDVFRCTDLNSSNAAIYISATYETAS